MKDLIPRQMFDVAIQAAIGAQIIARSTVKAMRKTYWQNVMVVTYHVRRNFLQNRKKVRNV